MNPIDMILDENNTDPVVLYNGNNERYTFEQIAVVPMEDKIFVILRPITPMEDICENEAFVFYIDQRPREPALVLVDDEDVIDAVFDVYYRLLEEADD